MKKNEKKAIKAKKVGKDKNIEPKKAKNKKMPKWITTILIIMSIIIIIGLISIALCSTNESFLNKINFIKIGSGNVVSEYRDVTYFDKVELRYVGNIYVSSGETNTLKIEAEDNIIPLLTTTIKDNKLIITKDNSKVVWINNTKPINIYVTMKDVSDLTINGSGDIISESQIKSDNLKLTINGSGDIILNTNATDLETNINGSGSAILTGYAINNNFNINGSGSLKALDLGTETTTVIISGSGNAEVNVTNNLDVTISGSGEVEYIGDPEVTTNISGSGSVNKIVN